jgi:hypothetical protein
VRGGRQFWSTLLIAVVAVVVLQALAGSATSPVERLLHVQSVPRWWPYVLAGLAGVVGGSLLGRGRAGGGAPGAAPRREEPPPTRGRRAVPRHVRRERERQRRRAEALAAAELRRREAEEDAARAAAAEASAAAPAPPPPAGRMAGLRRWAEGALGRHRGT